MRNGRSDSPPQTFPFSEQPYLLPVEDLVQALESDVEAGLKEDVVRARQAVYGPNAV
jgi:Cation transporter/ATPase, N-terminus